MTEELASEPEQETIVDIEKGTAEPEQISEVERGEYVTVKEIAINQRYSTAWISLLCKTGRIKAIKPLGAQWRIPKSEFQRIATGGLPPMPRKSPDKPPIKLRSLKPKPEPTPEGKGPEAQEPEAVVESPKPPESPPAPAPKKEQFNIFGIFK